MITVCFKRELYFLMVCEIESETALAKCPECLQGRALDRNHECYRVKTGEVPYELAHIHTYFQRSIIMLIRMFQITSYLHNVQHKTVIQLLRHGHDRAEIDTINNSRNIRRAALFMEGYNFIFDKIWSKHPDSGEQLSDYMPRRTFVPRDMDDESNSEQDGMQMENNADQYEGVHAESSTEQNDGAQTENHDDAEMNDNVVNQDDTSNNQSDSDADVSDYDEADYEDVGEDEDDAIQISIVVSDDEPHTSAAA